MSFLSFPAAKLFSLVAELPRCDKEQRKHNVQDPNRVYSTEADGADERADYGPLINHRQIRKHLGQ